VCRKHRKGCTGGSKTSGGWKGGVCNQKRVLGGENGCLCVKSGVGSCKRPSGSKMGAVGLRHRAGGVNRVLVWPKRGSGALKMGTGVWKRANKH
jgi:hypothetical protein